MDTIVVTISRGWIAKNLLGSDFYRILRDRYRLVIMTPAYKDERFLREYAHPNVRFLPLPELQETWIEEMLFFFHKHLIYNDTVNHHAKWGIIGLAKSKHPTRFRYYCIKIIFGILSRLRFLRDITRFFDRLLLQKKEVRALKKELKKIRPLCVVSTNVVDPGEVALMKAADDLEIMTVGFPKSWDNLSQHGFRFRPKLLVVWNDFMREQAIKHQNYPPERVVCVGVPQYDFNFAPEMLMSREEFAALYGLDPNKKIILLGSEGKLFPSDADIASILAEHIAGDALREPAQLLIRPHYGYRNDADKFAPLRGMEGVVIDMFNEPSLCFKDKWDYSQAFTKRFVNSMRHADIVVNAVSTLTLDAICFDTPVITIAFDGRMPLPYSQSIARWYETDYYKKILSYGATAFVRSPQELKDAVSRYLEDPSIQRAERMKLRMEFTHGYEGGVAAHFAELVTEVARKGASKK